MTRSLEHIRMIRDGLAPRPPVAELIGFTLGAVEPGRVDVVLEAGPRHANPMGSLFGGTLCDMADAAMGMAYATTLDGDNPAFTTVELKINFLRPFWTGRLTATGRVVQRGQVMGLVECAITDDDGHLIAKASCTCMTLRGALARGRAGTNGAAVAG